MWSKTILAGMVLGFCITTGVHGEGLMGGSGVEWPHHCLSPTDGIDNGETASVAVSMFVVPAVSQWGMLAMMLLVLTARTVALIRRQGMHMTQHA